MERQFICSGAFGFPDGAVSKGVKYLAAAATTHLAGSGAQLRCTDSENSLAVWALGIHALAGSERLEPSRL
nr:hypothetical protein [Thiohalomonas denitrificans]